MKNSFKILTVCVLALGFGTTRLAAQETTTTTQMQSGTNGMNFKVGVGASAGLPTSSSPFDYALGADVLLQWTLMPNLALTGNVGYTRFMVSGADGIGYIPAIGGVKVYPGIGNMYLAGNVGAGFAVEDGGKTNFVFGGGLGYDWDSGLTIGARYEGWQQDASSTTYVPVKMAGQFALRVGYNFKL